MQALRNVFLAFMTSAGILGPAIAQANEACVKKHLSKTAFRLDVKLGAPAETDEQRIAAFLQRVGSDLSPNDYAGLCRFLNSDSGAAALANAKWRVFEGQMATDWDSAVEPLTSFLAAREEVVSEENIDLADSLTRHKLTQYYVREISSMPQTDRDGGRAEDQQLVLEFYVQEKVDFLTAFRHVSSITVIFSWLDELMDALLLFPSNSNHFNKERHRADPNLIASRVAPEIDGLLEPLDGYRLLRIRPGTDVCAAKLSYILDEDERERVKMVFDYARSLAQAKRRKDRTDFDNALRAFVPNCT